MVGDDRSSEPMEYAVGVISEELYGIVPVEENRAGGAGGGTNKQT